MSERTPRDKEDLRRQAEERLDGTGEPAPPRDGEERLSLVHELQVHQVELELQNEEMQRTQDDLERLRRRYHLLFDEAPVGYVTLDAGGTIVEANQTLSGMLGVLPGRLPGSELARWCHRDSRPNLHLHLRTALTGGDSTELELIHPRGETLYVRVYTVPARTEAGELELHTAVSDITAQHRAEAALARSERRYQEMFEHAPLPYLSLDEDGRIQDVNHACLEALGYARKEEVLGHGFADFQTPASRADYRRHQRALREQGYLRQQRLDLLHRSGATLLTLADCALTDDPVTGAAMTQCIFADVTEQYRLLEELNRFRAQVDQSADGLFTIDLASGTVTECNQGAEWALGRPREQLLGASAGDLGIDLGDLDPGEDETEGRVLRVTELHRADGTGLPVELSAARVPDPGQAYLVVVARDISERLEAERQLLEKGREIEQAHREWLAAFDSLADPIFLHDHEGRVLRANRAYAERAGVAVSQVRGRPYWELFPPMEGPSPGCRRSLDGGDNVEQQEELELASGEVFQSRASSIFDAEGHYRFSVHVLTDITERRRHEAQLFRAMEATVASISQAMEMRDPYTAGHQQRVARLAVAIGREMGMDPEALSGLDFGGRIHDIGKIHIPAEILNRPGRLPPREFDLIKSHAEAGYSIIKDIEFPWPVAEMARQHHERLDGSGYPRGLRGEEIILEARIIAVADVVEAMTTHRPYRPALGLDLALEEISGKRGRLFDPDAVDACLGLFTEQRFRFEDA